MSIPIRNECLTKRHSYGNLPPAPLALRKTTALPPTAFRMPQSEESHALQKIVGNGPGTDWHSPQANNIGATGADLLMLRQVTALGDFRLIRDAWLGSYFRVANRLVFKTSVSMVRLRITKRACRWITPPSQLRQLPLSLFLAPQIASWSISSTSPSRASRPSSTCGTRVSWLRRSNGEVGPSSASSTQTFGKFGRLPSELSFTTSISFPSRSCLAAMPFG